MRSVIEQLISPLTLRRCVLPSRVIRSATYEGMADADGVPHQMLARCYLDIVGEKAGTIITGFCAVSPEGRAMHPGQAAIWDDAYIQPWREIVNAVRRQSPQTRLFMQIAHAGRQTLRRVTGLPVKGAGTKRCTYFRQAARPMDGGDIQRAVADYAAAGKRAQEAGFDGVQIHAAHGYLIHQFLSPHTNKRTDAYRDNGRFLEECVRAVREACGPDFPLLIKVCWADDRGLVPGHVIPALRRVERELDAVEVSYGTMEYALNIIRGGCPVEVLLAVNPLFSGIPDIFKTLWRRVVYPLKRGQFKAFTHGYNIGGAERLRDALTIPVIPVGGIHSLEDMRDCLARGFPALALCRPFVAEPDLMARLAGGAWSRSHCSACNLCTIHCDSVIPLRCHGRRKTAYPSQSGGYYAI